MFKKIIVDLFAKLGYMVVKLPTIENQIKSSKFNWLRNLNIKTVFDIGANDGQFAGDINKILPDAFIYSFEPLHDVFEQLKKNTESISNIECLNFAVGNEDGESRINRSEYSQSSSMLKMGKLHKEAYPFTAKTFEEKIKVRKLDSLSGSINVLKPVLLKMDVQGLELDVLKGATRLLQDIDVIITETSFFELYQNQSLFKEIFLHLDEKGFKYVGNLEQFPDTSDGKILQADSIFVKKNLESQ